MSTNSKEMLGYRLLLVKGSLGIVWVGGKRKKSGDGCMSLRFGCGKSLAKVQEIVPPFVGKGDKNGTRSLGKFWRLGWLIIGPIRSNGRTFF